MRVNLIQPTRKFFQRLWADQAVRWTIIVFLVLRVVTALAAMVIVRSTPVYTPSWLYQNPDLQTYTIALPKNSPLATVMEPWLRFDTAWYIHNAMQGYHRGDPGIVFPPLYPMTIRIALLFCGNNYVLAAVLASNLACLAAFFLLFKLVEFEFGNRAIARRTLICLAAFPAAYYLVAGYSEPLYLALTLGAFLAALNRRWWLAGLLAALTALTRLQGVMLCLPLGWIAYVQFRETGLRPLLKRLPVLVGGPIGGLVYLFYLSINQLGMLDSTYESKWQIYTRLPWVAIRAFMQRWASGQITRFEHDNALALALIVVLGLVVLFTLRPSYSLYVWSTVGVILLRYHTGPQFEGMVRYTLVMFPCFMVAGKLIIRRWWLVLPYGLGAVYWQIILLDRFTHWLWVA